jgi:hypothetical protein
VAAYDTVAGLRKAAGIDATLDVVLQRLIHPNTLDNIESYFEREAS